MIYNILISQTCSNSVYKVNVKNDSGVLVLSQMWGPSHCCLILCLWAGLDALPVAVDKTKVSPPVEELEPPKSEVSNDFICIMFFFLLKKVNSILVYRSLYHCETS